MRTLLISTDGGHLTELVAIAERLPAPVVDGAVWACIDSAHSRSVLEDRRAVFVPGVATKSIGDVIRSVPVARRLQREWQFTHVISTGSGIALAYLPYLALRGVRAHFIESATRLTNPSVTGRILQAVPGIRLYSQYESRARGRWHHAGWVYDGYVATRTEARPIKRAVVALGMMRSYPFRRLLDALVPLLGPGGRLEQAQGSPVETLWQTGNTPTDGLAIDGQAFVPSVDLDAAIADADVVIAHGGAGTSFTAISSGKRPVLVPRDPARREIVDDHQRQFARLLDERGIATLREPEALTIEDLLEAARHRVDGPATPIPFHLLP